MAFDFLSYLVDQTLQSTQLFVNHNKEKRYTIISHIAALSLIYLKNQSATQSYSIINQQHPNLDQLALPQEKIKEFSGYLSQNESFITEAQNKINQILLNELKQLDQSANLGEYGVKELIDGQLPWIQDSVESWLWDFINQPEHKITKTNKNENPDFNKIMKDFNEIILNKEQSLEHQASLDSSELTTKLRQPSQFYIAINPFIALIILLFLHNILL